MLKARYIEDSVEEIGVDEAGRGCLWGPLVAGAVLWPSSDLWTENHKDVMKLIKDSKKISPKKREKIYESICSLAVWGVGVVDACDIDKYGATWANQTAFRRALDNLQSKQKVEGRILIDGILPLANIKDGETHVTIVDGDAEYLTIAAASIIAKVYHDRWLREWCEQEDNKVDATRYDLLSCKGYGTAKHRAGILEHGYTGLHRKLYLRKLVPDIVVERFVFDDSSG